MTTLKTTDDINGILVIDKPPDFTSFDVVAKLRNILSIRKLGHGGTLDPMATGVLPIFINKATKAIDMIPEQNKSYLAGFKLGIKTNTQDITGDILCENKSQISKNELENILKNFIGDIYQKPPMYSAVKINGQRLYHLARQGKEIERIARRITIHNLNLLSFDINTQEGLLKADVSKGTYIRALINDIGDCLNVGATLTSLRRTKALGFEIDNSISLCEVEKIINSEKAEKINKKIIDLEKALKCLPKVTIDNSTIEKINLGQKIQINLPINSFHNVYDPLNKFLGVGQLTEYGIFKFKIKL